MKKWNWIVLLFFLLGFSLTINANSKENINIIKYVTDDLVSHVEVITPINISSITLDVFNANKEMTHSILLTDPVLKSGDNIKDNSNVFYITKDFADFDEFNELVLYSKTKYPEYFKFVDLSTQELDKNRTLFLKTSETLDFKVMSYNINHGKSLLGMNTLDEIADIIEESGADIIGLQEVDANFARSQFKNQIKYLADKLSMNYVYGDNVNIVGARYGNGILSKYDIISYENIKIPSGKEQRGLLVAVIDIDGYKINFLNTHLGLCPSERMTQIKIISNYLNTILGETILVGDFNYLPSSEEAHEMSKRLTDVGYATNSNRTPTFEVPFLSGRIDYIFIGSNIKPINYKVLYKKASDHYPIVADIKIIKS